MRYFIPTYPPPLLLAFGLIVALATVAPAHSATPSSATGKDGLISVFGDWSAFAIKEGGKPVCYAGGEPQKAVGNYKKRGDTFLLVTQRPIEKSFNVVSLKAGYTYKANSEVVIKIGGFKQKLFTDGGYAWAYDAKADKALVNAMKGGAVLIAKGTSNHDTATTDTYFLKGFTAANNAATRACGGK